jgi:NADH-quinone oxidoreductase subunit E
MIARVVALAAGVAAAAGAAGAALWARRRVGDGTARSGKDQHQAAVRAEVVRTEPQPERRAAESASVAGSTPAAPAGPEDLRSIKGIGAVSEERLRALGVTTVAHIAAWSEGDVESIAAQIKVSPERIRREDWVGQARVAAGET